MSEDLSRPRFNLEAMQAMVRMRIDLAKAEGEIAMQWEKVYGEKIKNERELTELNRLKDSIRDYQRARHSAEASARSQERMLQRWTTRTMHCSQLALGESISAGILPHAWIGFSFLLDYAPTGAKEAVVTMPLSSQHKEPMNFCRPSHLSVPAVPDTIRFSGPLFNWMRVNALVPCVGSAVMTLLGKAFQIIEQSAAAEMAAMQTKLEALKAELMAIREKGWKGAEITK